MFYVHKHVLGTNKKRELKKMQFSLMGLFLQSTFSI